MATLDEVRRLAAEFQRVQLTSAKQKLSERNVVELVNKLVDLKLIEVLYTSDGKEYLTPQHLAKEIRDELTMSGGRINLVDLQQALNVDLSHVEAKVNDLVKHDPSLTLVLGQLIDSSYREKLAAEINDLLQEQGQVTVGEVAQSHDLPPDFVREVVVGGGWGAGSSECPLYRHAAGCRQCRLSLTNSIKRLWPPALKDSLKPLETEPRSEGGTSCSYLESSRKSARMLCGATTSARNCKKKENRPKA
ncbi:hypothetical protein ACOMHN_022286 [Nucella lapillus]